MIPHSMHSSLSDPLKSYLSAYTTASSEMLTASNPLMAGLALSGEGRNVIKVPAHRPPGLPLPLDYASPWLYRPLTGLPSYLPLPSSLLLNRFGGKNHSVLKWHPSSARVILILLLCCLPANVFYYDVSAVKVKFTLFNKVNLPKVK